MNAPDDTYHMPQKVALFYVVFTHLFVHFNERKYRYKLMLDLPTLP